MLSPAMGFIGLGRSLLVSNFAVLNDMTGCTLIQPIFFSVKSTAIVNGRKGSEAASLPQNAPATGVGYKQKLGY